MKEIKIDPRIVKHLGRDLITTSEVAVIELVKNSLDARAKEINIRLYSGMVPMDDTTRSVFDEIVPIKFHNSSVLIVEDTGNGMTDQALDDGFLTVGTDIKAFDESVLGEKGIGRLATQRLGSALLVETCPVNGDHTSYVFLDWNAVINGSMTVPSTVRSATTKHTRLWIFDINLGDYIDNAEQYEQISLLEDTYVEPIVSRELRSALNFLVMPFDSMDEAIRGVSKDTLNTQQEKQPIPVITVWLDDKALDISFPTKYAALSESKHSFSFNTSQGISLRYGLQIEPWFAERVHLAIVKADAFKHLKRPHDYYRGLLEKNKSRLEQALVHTLTEEQLHNRLYKLLCDFYSVDDSQQRQEVYQSFLHEKADKVIEELKKINPISGAVYSFKQGVAIGDKIIADSAFELKRTKERLSSKQLSRFLEDYNGIKLYRGKYRIGFLGNKESDWIKLQQFRTKGQQWYRFDLGNTIGYVSINDSAQDHIQEISSRLDISQNQTSEAFKLLINLVFNYLFYELNKKANEIIRIFLTEEGLVEERITKKVKKSNEAIKAVLVRNKKMQKALKDVATHLSLHEQIDPDRVALPRSSFDFVTSTLSSIESDIRQDYAAQETTAHVLATADAQLSAVEVEAYNNYKLMANGLITETITHELHSLSETGIKADAGIHFAFLRDYFVQNAQAKVYNQHVHPIRNSYDGISGKLEEISDMYKFLETTFIKKGTYDEFVYQNIQDLVDSIKVNLIRTTKKEKIDIICETNDLEWCVPKGVMLHVFYNLFNNSLYWIDIRRKWAQSDPFYESNAKDCIVVEEFGLNGLIVSDSGTGVSREMEDLLFSPLESGRPAGEGRGMGLYIVKKLLKSFGADIELLEERNVYGNRYRFLIVLNSETK